MGEQFGEVVGVFEVVFVRRTGNLLECGQIRSRTEIFSRSADDDCPERFVLIGIVQCGFQRVDECVVKGISFFGAIQREVADGSAVFDENFVHMSGSEKLQEDIVYLVRYFLLYPVCGRRHEELLELRIYNIPDAPN